VKANNNNTNEGKARTEKMFVKALVDMLRSLLDWSFLWTGKTKEDI